MTLSDPSARSYPETRPLQRCLDQSDVVVALGLNPQIADIIRRHWKGEFRTITGPHDVAHVGAPDLRVCLLVCVDVFDEHALARLIATRSALNFFHNARICAVTSFMPGAYREFTMASGADECLTEADILIELEHSS